MERQLPEALLRGVRPNQWVSNLVVFAPLVFSQNLFDPLLLVQAGIGFVLLCALSGAVFLTNDIIDRERDRRHPIRHQRPVAAGRLSIRQAGTAAVILTLASLLVSFLWRPAFGLIAAGYLLLMLAYSLLLRRIPIMDVLTIAAGLLLRGVAGAVLIRVTVSPWLYLSVAGLGLILALGRIQHEMRLAQTLGNMETQKYTLEAVARMNQLAVALTLIVYCLYTFLAPDLPSSYSMMLTIPFVVYGIFRYRYLSYLQPQQQSPEQRMLLDAPLLIDVTLWVLTAVIVLYWLG
ncbi:MAG: UbiA family prenyltransferase [Anaerolineae bacterium]|nr:UbiA family prenyltransferase [Anaerolineae bacterium]